MEAIRSGAGSSEALACSGTARSAFAAQLETTLTNLRSTSMSQIDFLEVFEGTRGMVRTRHRIARYDSVEEMEVASRSSRSAFQRARNYDAARRPPTKVTEGIMNTGTAGDTGTVAMEDLDDDTTESVAMSTLPIRKPESNTPAVPLPASELQEILDELRQVTSSDRFKMTRPVLSLTASFQIGKKYDAKRRNARDSKAAMIQMLNAEKKLDAILKRLESKEKKSKDSEPTDALILAPPPPPLPVAPEATAPLLPPTRISRVKAWQLSRPSLPPSKTTWDPSAPCGNKENVTLMNRAKGRTIAPQHLNQTTKPVVKARIKNNWG